VADQERAYRFLVVLKPKVSWADEIYLGNMLVDAIGQVASMTGAFEFEVVGQDEKKQ
jgi:acetone carboxylase gamma subunit